MAAARRRRATPRGVLAADLRGRLGRGDGRRLGGLGDAQHRARAQHVHVLAEGLRVGLVDREHPAAGLGRVRRRHRRRRRRSPTASRRAAPGASCRPRQRPLRRGGRVRVAHGWRGRRGCRGGAGAALLPSGAAAAAALPPAPVWPRGRCGRGLRRAGDRTFARAGAGGGGATGALATADSPGAYTGGSSSIVYSRTRWPRDQLTSTSSVTNGSVIGSVECSWMVWRPSAAARGRDLDRAQVRRPVQAVAGEGIARGQLRPCTVLASSGATSTSSMSASSGALSGEWRWMSPRPKRKRCRRQGEQQCQRPSGAFGEHQDTPTGIIG